MTWLRSSANKWEVLAERISCESASLASAIWDTWGVGVGTLANQKAVSAKFWLTTNNRAVYPE